MLIQEASPKGFRFPEIEHQALVDSENRVQAVFRGYTPAFLARLRQPGQPPLRLVSTYQLLLLGASLASTAAPGESFFRLEYCSLREARLRMALALLWSYGMLRQLDTLRLLTPHEMLAFKQAGARDSPISYHRLLIRPQPFPDSQPLPVHIYSQD
jgi:hypothetical protein